MFARLGRFVYQFRFAVIAVMVAALAGLGSYGFDIGLGKHLSQGGYFDDSSQSTTAAELLDSTYGRDHNGDVLVLYTAPAGETIDSPQFANPIIANLNNLTQEYPDQIKGVQLAYWNTDSGLAAASAGDASKKHAFASIGIKGDDDNAVVANYQTVKNAFFIPGIDVQVGGTQAVTGKINSTMAQDQQRMELLAIPAVAVLLFFIFGGIVAAALPLIVGGLTIVGAWGIIRILTNFLNISTFVAPIVSMVALGLAIDYGLFMVSRFREEIAEGYDTGDAVRRTVMTAGRTVAMSATMIVASCISLLLFPQAFLRSMAYGAMASVGLAALTAVTVLPAILGLLGRRVDALGLKWLRKTRTADEIESGFWGGLTKFVMRNPLKVAIPIVIGLSLLIIPVKSLAFGGISETLLPPNDPTRLAQEHFDQIFPLRSNDTVSLVIQTPNSMELSDIANQADGAPGLKGPFSPPTTASKNGVYTYTAHVVDNGKQIKPTLNYLRSMTVPADANVMVTGQLALSQDSLDALIARLPLMIAIGVLVTTVLMFLTFGSLVLPIKAALMSALGLGSTLGMLTWVFIGGHGSSALNFTPGPIFAPILVLIIALIFGLSTDYEVFLLSRIVEARASGASTTEAVRIGMAHTSRIITAAALILIVVTGAFGFSHLVLMQYIACGMVSALIIDATLLRMFLVPATMKLLGDDCWWAPRWMKRIQAKIGLAEPILADERILKDVPVVASAEPVSDRLEDARTLVIPSLATGSLARLELDNQYRIAAANLPKQSAPEPTAPLPPAPEPPASESSAPEPPAAEQQVSEQPAPEQQVPEQPAPESPAPPTPPAPESGRTPRTPRTGPPSDRRGVENWLADLRNTADEPAPLGDFDSGRHYRGTDSVSVNDLLRRDKP